MERLAGRLRRSRSHRSEARAIDDLYRSLLLHVDPEPLYASVLARLGEIASCERCALFLVDARDGALRLHAQRGSWSRELEVTLGLELPEVPVLVRGDAGQLEQVLLNLLLNALDAVDGGGEVRVRLAQLPGERAGRVQVEVHDSGPGVPAEARDRLFDPFFTTKPEGSGLGLPISYNIVRQHGGDLTLEDHPDGAAVARFTLPEARS